MTFVRQTGLRPDLKKNFPRTKHSSLFFPQRQRLIKNALAPAQGEDVTDDSYDRRDQGQMFKNILRL